jgi:single-stranded DNA-binding protein
LWKTVTLALKRGISLASNVRVPRDGECVVETIWIRVTCWGRMAETANQYIKKGDRVCWSPATG